MYTSRSLRFHAGWRRGVFALLVALLGGFIVTIASPVTATPIPVSIYAGAASVLEGDSGSRTLFFPITLSNPATVTTKVSYMVTGSSATSGTDFVAKSGKVTFTVSPATGLTPVNKTLPVTVSSDTTLETDETLTLTLSLPTGGALIAHGTGTGTILNDDAGTGFRVGAGDVTIYEGNTAGPRKATFAVTLSQPATTCWPSCISVRYSLTGETATAGTDFAAKSGTLNFSPGQVEKTVVVDVYSDTDTETNETVALTLSAAKGATIIRNGTLTIANDDGTPPDSDKTAWAWGDNYSGQLGDGTTDNTAFPIQVGTATTWETISTAWDNPYLGHVGVASCGTRSDGTAWCWGSGYYGQLGNGTTTSTVPVQVDTATNWATISAGGSHTCGTGTDGTAWCWGGNQYGQLGNGTTTNSAVPLQVGTATNWTTISAGGYHTCGTRSDGTAWCWGANESGQSAVPLQVGTATNWTTISAGGYHTCGTRSDGTAWCWGSGYHGQLGNGTTTPSTVPVQVGTATTWATISVAGYTSCGTRSDGTAWCWGDNEYGQLGDGTTTNSAVPLQVGTATTWATISSGGWATCGTRTDGTAWCWGWNYYGQLGNGTSGPGADSAVPLQVGTATTWTTISAGGKSTLGIQTSG